MKNPSVQISLVICTYNRCQYLPQSLESVSLQSFSKEKFELIVVDNASTDRTGPIVKEFIQQHPSLNVRYVFEANKGLSFARNRGANEAVSDIVAYIDDDVILFPDYLEKLNEFFKKYPHAAGAGGRVIPKYEQQEPVWMSKYLKGFVGEVYHGNEVKKFAGKMKYPAGANMIYRKSILEKAGGFNNQLQFRSDDKYIYYKIHQFTDEVYFLPDVVLYHYIDSARLSASNFKKLFLKTGNEEKKRLKSEGKGLFKKCMEYGFKVIAGIGLYFIYLFKRQPSKGSKIFLSQWYTFVGFLKSDVFVR